METVGIILASILGGIFVVVLVGGMATLIVLHIRGQKSAKALEESMGEFMKNSERAQEDFKNEISRIVTESSAAMGAHVESARSSFSGVRTEVAKALETQLKAVSKALKDQEQVFADKVGNINGEVLQAASIRALQSCRDLSSLTITLRNMLVEHEVQPGTNLAPEEYGPSDTIYAMQGAVDRADAASIRDEAEESQPLFSQGMTE